MAYVIVTTRPKELQGVFAPHSFLSEAQWCTEAGALSTVLTAVEGEFSFILIDYDNQDFFHSPLLSAKKKAEFKLVYFSQELDGPTLREHQAGEIGGDAYLPFSIPTVDLEQMLLALTPEEMNTKGNRLESGNVDILKKYELDSLDSLEKWGKSFASQKLDEAFEVLIVQKSKIKFQSVSSFAPAPEEESVEEEVNLSEEEVMSDKDQDLSLDDLGDLELGADESVEAVAEVDEGGFDLSLGDSDDLSLSEEGDIPETSELDDSNDFSLDDGDDTGDDFSLSDEGGDDDGLSLGDDDGLSLSDDSTDEVLDLGESSDDFSLSGEDEGESLDFSLGGDDEVAPSLPEADASSEDLGLGDLDLSAGDDDLSFGLSDSDSSAPKALEADLSEDALAKLKEIDEMMGDPVNESLVSDDIDLGGLDLSGGDDDILAAAVEPEAKKPAKKKKEAEVSEASSAPRNTDQDIKQIVGSYSGEMERLAATLSNLRSDREELLAKIQKLEEEKIMQQRQNLSLRAELDEKKIELTIIKKKLNEENNELKDKLKIQEEMKLIWEERNRLLQAEVEKISQKTRFDVKKVQGRERELEQKLELLKADAETQIRHRDQKILELKRRIDGMEFDMESMGHQEKKSLEGKVELEQKLDKAIRTLRGAITILENDSEAAQVLEKLKKNIEV